MMPSAHEIGEAVRRFADVPSSYSYLDATAGIGGTWTAGGCWILADAIRRRFGGELLAVRDRNGVIHHIVVRCDDVIIDADGASSGEELLRRWRERERLAGPYLSRFDPAHVHPEIPRPGSRSSVDQQRWYGVTVTYDTIAGAIERHLEESANEPITS